MQAAHLSQEVAVAAYAIGCSKCMKSSLSLCDAAGVHLQATFSTEAQLQQHNEGPTHRKALARIQAQQEKKRRIGQNSGAAEAALVRMSSILQHVDYSAATDASNVWSIEPLQYFPQHTRQLELGHLQQQLSYQEEP